MVQDFPVPIALTPNENSFNRRIDPFVRLQAGRDQARWYVVSEKQRIFAVTDIKHNLKDCKEKFGCHDAPPEPPFSEEDVQALAKPKPVHRSGQPVPHAKGTTHLFKCTYTLFQEKQAQSIDEWDPDITIDWP